MMFLNGLSNTREKLFVRMKGTRGATLLEVLISAFITAIIVASVFNFYTNLSHQSEVQVDVSEVQHVCRVSIFEIGKTLHKAGNRLGTHPPYEIKGDTLAVYFSETQPVDSVIYFLQEYTDSAYLVLPNLPTGTRVFDLMKRVNSAPAEVFCDFITGVSFVPINPTNIAVTVSAISPRQDDTYAPNNGYRTYSMGERVNLRYLSMLLGT